MCWRNQAKKSIGRMPRHQAPKKDVASCEKLRGAASRQRTVDIRMGKPGGKQGGPPPKAKYDLVTDSA